MAKAARKRNYRRNEDGSIYIAGDSKTLSSASTGGGVTPLTITVTNDGAQCTGNIIIPSDVWKYESTTYGINAYAIGLKLHDPNCPTNGGWFTISGHPVNILGFLDNLKETSLDNGSYNGKLVFGRTGSTYGTLNEEFQDVTVIINK